MINLLNTDHQHSVNVKKCVSIPPPPPPPIFELFHETLKPSIQTVKRINDNITPCLTSLDTLNDRMHIFFYY